MSSENKMSTSFTRVPSDSSAAAPSVTHHQQQPKNKRKLDDEDDYEDDYEDDDEDDDEDEDAGEGESDRHANKRRKPTAPARFATSTFIPPTPPTPRPRGNPPMPVEDDIIPTPRGRQDNSPHEVVMRHDKIPVTVKMRERVFAMVKTTNPSQRSKQARIKGWTFQVVKQSGTEHFEFHASFDRKGSAAFDRMDYLRRQFAGILPREGWQRIDRLSTGPTKFVQKWGTHEPPPKPIVMPTLYWWQQMLLDHVRYCKNVAEPRHYFWVVGNRGQGKTKCAMYLEQKFDCCRLVVPMTTERKKKIGIVNLLKKTEKCSNKALLIELPFNEDRQADMEVSRHFYTDLESLTDGDYHDNINHFCVVFAKYGPPPTEGDDRRVLIDIDTRFVYCFDNRTNKCTRFLAADENGQLLEHFQGPCFLDPEAWMHHLSRPLPST